MPNIAEHLTGSDMERECIICFTPLNYAHLGINSCRACAMFYKRTVAIKSRIKCKNGDRQCLEHNPKSTCRLCRFTKIEGILQKAGGDCSSNFSKKEDEVSVKNSKESIELTPARHELSCCVLPVAKEESVLHRLRVQYRSMCHTRLIAETIARGQALHPLLISIDAPPTYPATLKSNQTGNQILIATALEFGSIVFPEFATFDEQEKWSIVTEFFYRFKTFEGSFRAEAFFPDDPNRFLPSYTTYIGPDVYISWKDEMPENADLQGAYDYVTNNNYRATNIAAGREIIAKLKPSEEEFLAITGLMFWALEDLALGQEIRDLAERYRKQIMGELHAYYREKLKLEDYATRLGELLMLLQVFDVKEQFKEHLEMMRLLNIIDDDTFVYTLTKKMNF